MTKLLKRAFQEASKLSAEEQDAIAASLLEDLAAEKSWTRAFETEASQQKLADLAAEALEEHQSGTTQEIDPDAL